MRPLRIYSLNNSPIKHTAVLFIFIMLYTTYLILILQMEVLPFNWLHSVTPSSSSPASGNQKCDLFSYEFEFLLKYN